MDDDNAKTARGLQRLIGAYAELYPSIGPRLEEAKRVANPEIRRRVTMLDAAFAARAGHRRQRIMQTYGLTPTEAQLAMHLADGGSVAGYAERFKVSVGTVRTHLKSIFAKTGTGRQTELASLVGRR